MRVVNIYKEKYTTYIGRGSIFGNPFKIGKDGDREEVIKKYRNYILCDSTVFGEIRRLPKDSILGCFCKPKACHGDVIVELYNDYWEIK